MNLVNKILKERYKITELIAEGGMASVYKGTDIILQRTVAVKILRENLAMNEELVERFYREARSAAKLSHPNIVNIYDIGNEENIYFIVMEYLSGGTLDKLISRNKPLPVNEVVRIGMEICEALEFAHNNGVIHRDIKAQNVMLTENNKIKVVDFGIARLVDTGTMTKPGTVMGSVYYFSPEQAEGKETTSASDIYSTGVLLYYMATGRYPFDGEHVVSIALKHIKDSPVPPGQLISTIPDKLEKIILKAMSKSPGERPESANIMVKALNSVLSSEKSEERDEDYLIKLKTYEDKILEQEKTIIRKAPPASTKSVRYEETDDFEPPRQRMNASMLITAIGLITIIGFIIGIAIPKFISKTQSNPTIVTVPSLVGKSQAEAEKELYGIGLIMDITSKEDPNIPEGYIIAQNPLAGIGIEVKSRVQVIVSLGKKEKVIVPNIIGKTVEEATIELNSLELVLRIEKVEKKVIEKFPPGTIISQDPNSGDEVDKNFQIKVVVNKTEDEVLVPDLKGLTADEAKEMLKGYNLKLKIKKEENNVMEKGLIISQLPEAGKKASKDSNVEVVVSSGPEMITVPDVVGMNLGRARELLIKEKLGIKFEEGQFGESDDDIIVKQTPLSGEKVASGTSIIVGVESKSESPSPNSTEIAEPTFPSESTPIPTQKSSGHPTSKPVVSSGTVVVPDLSGLSKDKAIEQIKSMGLTVGNIQTTNLKDSPKGVIGQNLRPGMSVDKGSLINLIVNQ